MSCIISQFNMTFLLFLTFLLSSGAIAQQTLFPPAIPLAVRSPYLNSWLNPTNGSTFRQLWQWPTTYTSTPVCLSSYLPLTVKLSSSLASEPRVVGPCTCRWPDLFVPGCYPQSQCNREHDKYRGHAYADHLDFTSRPHGIQSYLPKSYRGSFRFNLLPSRTTYASLKARRLGQAIHSVLIRGSHRKITRRQSPRHGSVFGCQRRYVRSPSEARRASPALLQNGTRAIETR